MLVNSLCMCVSVALPADTEGIALMTAVETSLEKCLYDSSADTITFKHGCRKPEAAGEKQCANIQGLARVIKPHWNRNQHEQNADIDAKMLGQIKSAFYYCSCPYV